MLEGGALTLEATKKGIKSEDAITITNVTLDVITATEGIKSKDKILVNAGEITINASDDGLNASNDITINGGQLYVNVGSEGDAVDSGGTLNINGGLIVALGGEVSGKGLACDDAYAIVFNGGTVVATGSDNSTPSDSSGQHVAVIDGQEVGTAIHIERDDGVDVLTFQVSKAYQSMIFTSPLLLGNRDYTVSTGGSISGGVEFHGLYTGATYTGGSEWTTFTTTSVVTYVGGGGSPSPPGP